MFIRNLRTGVIFSLVLAFVVTIAIAFYADIPRMVAALTSFRWEYLPLILGLTLFNYFGRFLKWQYYLKRLDVKIQWPKSLLIFLSGLSMAITPGKIGELLKSYLLKRSTGEQISRTSPIIVAERLTDGLAMLLLAATGLILYQYGWSLLLILLLVGLAGILAIQNRSLSLAILHNGERLPGMSRIANLIRAFYESTYTLLQWQPLLLAVFIGVISWLGECTALYFVFLGLGIPPGVDLMIKAMFILAVSSLIGSASGLPGGLGTADGSMIGLMRLLVSTSAALGGAATLLIRLCTLWFGLGLGIVAMLLYRTTQPAQQPSLFTQQEEGVADQRQATNYNWPLAAHDANLKPASIMAKTGDRIV